MVSTGPYRSRPLLLLETANFASGVGNSIVMIAIPWLVLETTGSAAAAGVVGAASGLPAILVAPVAGLLVDRLGRRVVSVGSDLLSAVSVALIPVAASAGELTLPAIAALAVLGATFDPAGYTARRSLIVDVAEAVGVGVDRLNGIHQGIAAMGWTLGPLVGAALIALVGATGAFWLPFALFLVAALCLGVLRVGDAGQRARAEATERGERLTSREGAFRGFTALWRDRPIRLITLAVVILAAVYLPTEAVILPAYFQGAGEPGGLGVVLAALAAGSVIGAFSYGWLSGRFPRSAIARIILAGTALSVLPMALLLPLPILAAAAFALGLAWGPADPLMATLVQRRIRHDEQGRVFGVQLSLIAAAPPIAILFVGLLVEAIGVGSAFLMIAALLAAVSLAMIIAPGIGELDDDLPG
jgi:MFS family permease